MRLASCLNIADLRRAAERRLPHAVYPHLIGAAEDEQTLRRNTEVFDEVELLPQTLVDVGRIRAETRLLGQKLAFPLYCSPTGASRLFHPEGELAVARAAAKAGIAYGLSTVATHSIEAVAAAGGGPKFFQTFIFRDRGLTLELVARAKATGYEALILTVDSPVRGNCERELRDGMLAGLKPLHLLDFALHPRWSLGQLRRGRFALPFAVAATGSTSFARHSAFVAEQLDPGATWADLAPVVEAWGGPVAIKGIMVPDDARRALDAGAQAIIVSNHGGRQVDGTAPALAALPAVAAAVGGRAEIVLDGGVRRGVHILKALALGATACSIGRPCLFGLAAGGEAGVERALTILRSEFERAMKLAGVADSATAEPSLLRRRLPVPETDAT